MTLLAWLPAPTVAARAPLSMSLPLLAMSLLAAACMPTAPSRSPVPDPAPPPGAEAVSLLGRPLVAPALAPDVRRRYEARLAAARAELVRAPGSADALVWVGRRTAYLGRFREAIDLFTQGIAKYPDDARFLRHRGHRYLTVRSFERATVDLERAVRLIGGRPDQVEPDGLPNARNTPTSTLHSNSWYHLGLARYLRGDFERALLAWRACLSVSKNADMQVATTHWLYMTLRRLGRTADADAALVPIRRDMDVIENGSYLRLLLMYKGELAPDSCSLRPPAPTAQPRTPRSATASATGTSTAAAARRRSACSGGCSRAATTGPPSATSPPRRTCEGWRRAGSYPLAIAISAIASSSFREWCIEQNFGPHIAQNSALLKYSAGSDSSWYSRARSGSSERRNCSFQSKA